MKLDLLLRNADIITMDERRPHATSLGVWQGRIVGLDDDLDGLDAAEVLDLGGATVTPGFIDAHCHTTWFGLGLGELDVSAARGLTQLYALLEAGMAADSARPEAGPGSPGPDRRRAGCWPPASASSSTAASSRTSPSWTGSRETGRCSCGTTPGTWPWSTRPRSGWPAPNRRRFRTPTAA